MTKTTSRFNYKSLTPWLITIGLVLLVVIPRITALNQYLIVDEADRWRWAKDFVYALSQGDLAATLIGDGYPGIVPVWAESIWIFAEAFRRSFVEGQWLGDPGLYNLFHQWDRPAYLLHQRLPIVILNIVIALSIIGMVWRIWGKWVALISGIFIALDPFYLSDSRVNRAEAVITGLMTLSILFLILYYQKQRFRYIFLSGIFGGLSFLTKIQALIMLPVVVLVGLLVVFYPPAKKDTPESQPLHQRIIQLLKFGLIWGLAATLVWFILWPSMWVVPLDTLQLVFSYTTRKVGAEGVNLFFWGQTYSNTDPGILFYPVVFFLRLTPFVLVGLIGALFKFFAQSLPAFFKKEKPKTLSGDPFAVPGSIILVVFVLLYTLLMTAGSHKQDRYLLPIFLSVDILAALGLVYVWAWVKSKINQSRWVSVAGAALVALLIVAQLAVVLPHHPYYYSYFNPLFGGGKTAAKILRIGWGEGMDQVGAYLAVKPNSEELVVSSRFTDNMLGFEGDLISTNADGRWTQSDYLVLYIQQVQRRLDPGPGFFDYFQTKTPEKIITLGDVDYAWIYPIPFDNPANPQVSQISQAAALLGYSWEDGSGDPQLRLLWENLGLNPEPQLMMRLSGENAQTPWVLCEPDTNFVAQAGTAGNFVETICQPRINSLPVDTYTIEFGIATDEQSIESFRFPEGAYAVRVMDGGQVEDTSKLEQLNAIAWNTIPQTATPLDAVYDGRVRLTAYQLDPAQPQPGDAVELILYWQPLTDMTEPFVKVSNTGAWGTEYYQANKADAKTPQLVVQLSDSRRISLGVDQFAPPLDTWLMGEISTTHHSFEFPADLDVPLAAQIEVDLLNELDVATTITTIDGVRRSPDMGRFTIAPHEAPDLGGAQAVDADWQNGITLRGYRSPSQVKPGDALPVSLLWETSQPVIENYMVFVHLVDENGEIKAQNDSLPRVGAYPTPWWQPGQLIEDVHSLAIPADVPAGTYQLLVGLYTPEDWVRLPLTDGADSIAIGILQVQVP